MDNETSKFISLGIFLAAALTDWYDGWLARKLNYMTSWGKFWDPLADKILTAAAFIGFVYLGKLEAWMVIIVLSRDFIVTLLRGYADYKKKSFPTSRYAKWKTFFQMIFLYYLLIFYVLSTNSFLRQKYGEWFAVLLNPSFIYFGMLFITLITVHSGFTYIYDNRKLIKELLT
jgi:CDP-diacylglycerol--glycerol-3-phosphate 3-phosphatidyltransferase